MWGPAPAVMVTQTCTGWRESRAFRLSPARSPTSAGEKLWQGDGPRQPLNPGRLRIAPESWAVLGETVKSTFPVAASRLKSSRLLSAFSPRAPCAMNTDGPASAPQAAVVGAAQTRISAGGGQMVGRGAEPRARGKKNGRAPPPP